MRDEGHAFRMNDIEPIPAYVGCLGTGVRPVGYPRKGGSARSARLTILPDRLIFQPFGLMRGIFHDVTLMKHRVANIHPTPEVFVPLACRIGSYIVFEQPVPGSAVGESIVFFPRKVRSSDILNALEASGYAVDRRPRKTKIFG